MTMQVGDGQADTAHRIASRIRQTIVRERALPLDFDVETAPIPPDIWTDPDPETLEADQAEQRELELDVGALHETWDLGTVNFFTSPRRFLGPLLGRMRLLAAKLSRPILVHQTTVNARVVRSLSVLRNTSIRQDQATRSLGQALVPAVRAQASAIGELDRRLRVVEEATRPTPPLAIDNYSLADRFRGDEATIRERLRRYVRHFESGEPVLELGAGRGEFLELLREAGIPARGVDLDPRMVEHARSKQVSVERRDALEALEEAAPGSLGGVFAAQLVEHMEPAAVVRLVRLAARALAPGGRLVLETPNPETLITFATFYLDPTHVQPYSAELVRWLLEQEGFVDVEIEYSLPADEPVDVGDERLNALLFGYRAYAVSGVRAALEP
jgi:SAM-dependent methyltransferase